MKKVNLKIYGMHSSSCVENIENALRKIRGVTNAKVNLMNQIAEVEMAPYLDINLIIKAIQHMNYDAAII